MTPDPAQLQAVGRRDHPERRRSRRPPGRSAARRRRLAAMTRRVALLGKPLRRRHSQVMHDAAFDAAGIDARYVLLRARAGRRSRPRSRRRAAPDWLGLGVTAPYKRVVAGLCRRGRAATPTRDRRRQQRRRRTPTAGSSGSTATRRGSGPASSCAMGRPLAGADGRRRGRRRRGARGRVRLPRGGRAAGDDRQPDRRRGRHARDRFASIGRGRRGAPCSTGPAFDEALAAADLAVNATTVGMVDPGDDDRRRRACRADGDGVRPRLRPGRDAAPRRGAGARAAGGERLGDAHRPGRDRVRALDRASAAWPT